MLYGGQAGELHDRINERLGRFKLNNAFFYDHLGFFCILKLFMALFALLEMRKKILLFLQSKL